MLRDGGTQLVDQVEELHKRGDRSAWPRWLKEAQTAEDTTFPVGKASEMVDLSFAHFDRRDPPPPPLFSTATEQADVFPFVLRRSRTWLGGHVTRIGPPSSQGQQPLQRESEG